MTKIPGRNRTEITPGIEAAWHDFSRFVFKNGTWDEKAKQLVAVAVAVAHVTQRSACIKGHAANAEALFEQMMEAISVPAEMRAGGAVVQSRRAVGVSPAQAG